MNGIKARDIILRMVANFPGLIDDREVNGAELVDWMSNEMFACIPDTELSCRALNGTPNDDEGDN